MTRLSGATRLALAAAALAAAAGCAEDSDLLRQRVSTGGDFSAELAGRTFLFRTVTAEIDPIPVLQIEGDGVIVAFRSSTPPLAAAVSGDGVDWGGRRFEATATPNEFIVDGQPQSLPAPGIYHFADGVFVGQHPFQ